MFTIRLSYYAILQLYSTILLRLDEVLISAEDPEFQVLKYDIIIIVKKGVGALLHSAMWVVE